MTVAIVPLQTWGGELPVQYSSNLAIVFMVIFSLVMIGIGILAGRYQSSEEDYYVAGRSAGILVIALSVFASIQSGWGIVGFPGSAYQTGFEFIFIMGTSVILGFVVAYWLLARKMRLLGEVRNAITAPDAMYYRFEDERVRLLGAAAVFLGSMGYLASQYAALGIIGALVLPVGFYEALIVGLIVLGFYTVIGGILAAIWSDAIQGGMMIIGAFLTVFYVFTNFEGGFDGMVTTLQSQSPEMFQFTLLGGDGLASVGFLLSAIIIGLTLPGQPHAITKFYMSKRVSILKWGALISGLGYLMTSLYWWVGPLMRAAVSRGQFGGELPATDVALPMALIEYAPPVVTAFVLTSIVAAIMSTSNAFLNIGAAAIVHDFLIQYMNTDLSDSQQVLWSRVVTGGLLVGAGVIAATFPGLIFVLGAAGWAIFASVIFPGVALAYNWRGATTEGILWGGAVGLGTTVAFAYGAQYVGLTLPVGLLGGQVATVLGILVFIGVSLVTDTCSYNDVPDDIQTVLDVSRVSGQTSDGRALGADGGSRQADQER
ncbi:sodium:solute symporter family transporter [Natrinema halophilum]|uniref:Na+:solute symporter n=1 Tax=Natrinema halophilum TaxID=1699371 RepID=A0A7D5KKK6_9EURY|nr:Na+:solute symporter [Natrinema halophilum]QLG49118.1 Na+:solute symporter [Natrinema halophilum]